MSNKITFEVKNIPFEKISSTLFVIGQYKEDKVNKNLDTLFNGRVSTAIKVDSFKGVYNKKIELLLLPLLINFVKMLQLIYLLTYSYNLRLLSNLIIYQIWNICNFLFKLTKM